MNEEGNQLISISTLELFGRSLGSSNYLALSRSIAIIGKPRRSDPAAFPVQQPNTRSKSRARNILVSEPGSDMADQRLEHLEKDVSSLSTGQQDIRKQMLEGQERMMKQMKQIQDMCADIKASIGVNSGEETSSKNQTGRWGEKSENRNSFVPKLTKLQFPKYNGSLDPTRWVCRAEQFFEFQNIAEEENVPLAAYNLEEEAQLWYQLFQESDEALTWETLKEGMHARYGPTQFEDYFGDLTKLRQTGSVREYQGQYERLLSKAGKLTVM